MRTTGASSYFRTPKNQGKPSRQLLVIILLTIVLPPLGLICLWRGARCPVRGKILISILGVLSMTLFFSIFLSRDVPIGDSIPIQYQYTGTVTAAPTIIPAPNTLATPVPANDVPGEVLPEDGFIPANPAG